MIDKDLRQASAGRFAARHVAINDSIVLLPGSDSVDSGSGCKKLTAADFVNW